MYLDNIIEERIPRDQINQLYYENKIDMVERLILYSLKDDNYFHSLLTGRGEYKIRYDRTVPEDYYFTNVEALLGGFYSLYDKFPKYHIDKVFEEGLKDISSNKIDLYAFFALLNQHLLSEKNGDATFSIKSTELLKKASKFLQEERYRKALQSSTNYHAKGNPEGMLGVYKDYNKNFIENAGVDIFEKQEDEPAHSIKL